MWFNQILQRQDIIKIKLLVWKSAITKTYELKNIYIGVRTIAPKENWTPIRVRFWV